MPFTPTHVLAVLPAWPLRRAFPFSAFAIGAMIPDAPLFFPIVTYAQTHSPWGVVTVCLPLGIAAFFLFERVMRRPLIALLPAWIGARVSSTTPGPRSTLEIAELRYFAAVAIAIVIGAYTHQIWDAFTHRGQWGTQLLPSLNADLAIGVWQIPTYKILQHGSTLVGLPLLAGLSLLTLNRVTPTVYQAAIAPKGKLLAAGLILAVPIGVAIPAYLVSPNLYQTIFLTVTRSGAILLAMLLAYSLLFSAFVRRTPDG
ncbi:MAG: DUF4184 family protein [Cyanobacteria bacterium P01_C01_bin.120]